MRYDFVPPQSWSRRPFPPPGRGIYLRSPVVTSAGKVDPGAASILLFDAVSAEGTLEAHLATFVERGCAGVKIVKTSRPASIKAGTFAALRVDVVVQIQVERKMQEETRIFVLADAGSDRLPITFLATARAPAAYAEDFAALLATIAGLPLVAPPFASYLE